MPPRKFNPPPNWPDLPKDWEPDPQWQPPSSWPAAPPGWTFWIDEDGPDGLPAADADTATSSSRGFRWDLLAPLTALGLIVCLGIAFLVSRAIDEPNVSIRPMPHTAEAGGAIVPDWPAPWAMNVDFSTWTGFGGVDAKFSDHGRSVVLDTHDTTATWATKWSGLIQQGSPMCAMRFRGRVRDLSHTRGVAGGFAIGLGTLTADDPANATLSGTAVQIDYGQRSFRTTAYPSDAELGSESAALDHEWHEVEVIIDDRSHTLLIDGLTVARTDAAGTCGHPFIRVWAGAAEFSDFTFA